MVKREPTRIFLILAKMQVAVVAQDKVPVAAAINIIDYNIHNLQVNDGACVYDEYAKGILFLFIY